MLAEAKAQGRRDRRDGREVPAETIDAARRSRRRPRRDRIIAAAKAEIAAGSRAREGAAAQPGRRPRRRGAAKILKREVDAEGARRPARDDPPGTVDDDAWLNSPRSPGRTPKPRSRSRATSNALPAWSEMLRFAASIVGDPRVAAALDNPRLDSRRQGIAAAVDRRRPASTRRPQLPARADRRRPRRVAAADRSDVRHAEGRRRKRRAKATIETAFPMPDAAARRADAPRSRSASARRSKPTVDGESRADRRRARDRRRLGDRRIGAGEARGDGNAVARVNASWN